MAEVLTQSQIDALLNSMKSGESEDAEVPEKPEKTYRNYDFYSPKKFTKDKLKMLKGIYDNYARIATSQINSLFRVNSMVEVMTVEEQRYYEFSNALSDNDMLTLVNVKLPEESKHSPMLMHVSQILMVNMIDRMLGGIVCDTTIDSSYTYTDLELPLYNRIIQYLIMMTRDAWSSYVKLQTELERIEENPSLFQDISVDETVVIIMLNVDMQEISGKISICIPENLLSAIFDFIDKRKRSENDHDNILPNVKDEIMGKVKSSALTIRAELGNTELSLGDISGLRVGDVIDLNKPQDSEVSLYVEEQPWFVGKLGVHNKNMTVRINRRMDEDPPIQEVPVRKDTVTMEGPETTESDM